MGVNRRKYDLTNTYVYDAFSIFPNSFAASNGDGEIIINIDNPNFRRLVVAMPTTRESSASGDLAKRIEIYSREKLPTLINFFGLFNIMSESAYGDMLEKIYEIEKASSSAEWLKSYDAMKGDRLSEWKNVGVEGVVLASIGKNRKHGTYVIVKIFDVASGKEIKVKLISQIKDLTMLLKELLTIR